MKKVQTHKQAKDENHSLSDAEKREAAAVKRDGNPCLFS